MSYKLTNSELQLILLIQKESACREKKGQFGGFLMNTTENSSLKEELQ